MKQNIRRQASCLLILCMTILCLLPPSVSLAAGQTKYVLTENGRSLNVRDFPGKKGTVISRLANGSKVTVVSDEGDWVEIEMDGRTGYVMEEFLTGKKPAEKAPAESEITWKKVSKTMYVKTGNRGRLNLRTEASRKSKSQGLFANGTKVSVSALSDAWAKVTVNGLEGFMQLSCLTEEAQKAAGSSGTQYIKGNGSVRMYDDARTDAAVLMVLPGRTAVKVYAEDGAWTRITAHGQVGYVKTSSLTDEVPAAGTKFATVVNPNGASYVNLRSSPGMTGSDNILAHVRVDSRVEVIGRKRTWIKISVSGMVGYVHRSFLIYDS